MSQSNIQATNFIPSSPAVEFPSAPSAPVAFQQGPSQVDPFGEDNTALLPRSAWEHHDYYQWLMGETERQLRGDEGFNWRARGWEPGGPFGGGEPGGGGISVQPMYGAVRDPEPIGSTGPVIQPMYGVIADPNPVGGGTGPVIQPMYGVIADPNGGGTSPVIQPMYGVIADPNGGGTGPVVQPLYGVIAEPISLGTQE